MLRHLFFILAALHTSLAADFVKPHHIPESVWETVSPYFIPEDHPMKPKLDEVFSSQRRVISTTETLKKAGFKNAKPGRWKGTIVAYHPSLEGYLVKMYSDDQTEKIDWAKFIDRVKGSLALREAIDRYQWHDLFKVPNKWIYPLPENPAPTPGKPRKNFILLVEDMNLLSKKANLKKWERSSLPKKYLNCLFVLISEVGLRDSVYAFNIPFSTDGKIAFIDTEHYHKWPVHYRALLQYLSPCNREYWKQLINIQEHSLRN